MLSHQLGYVITKKIKCNAQIQYDGNQCHYQKVKENGSEKVRHVDLQLRFKVSVPALILVA